jgi:hypothetical protein
MKFLQTTCIQEAMLSSKRPGINLTEITVSVAFDTYNSRFDHSNILLPKVTKMSS